MRGVNVVSNEYVLAVGEADRLRLEILNKMYNPLAQYFLIKNGLKSGMTVLEFGCGAGDMACWLAQRVGPQGKVVAVDSSPEQIAVCEEKAKGKSISNIDFHCLDVSNIETLPVKFDLIYGRWVLFFQKNIDSILESLTNMLNQQGVLTYETAQHVGEGCFSYPDEPVVAKWFQTSKEFFEKNGFCIDLGNQLYHKFLKSGLVGVDVLVSHPVMITSEEKSVLRLGTTSIKREALKLMTKAEYENYVQELKTFEQSDSIAAFYRNVLVAGRKNEA